MPFTDSEPRTISFPVVNEQEHQIMVDVAIIVIQDNVLSEEPDSTIIKEERMVLDPGETRNISVVQDPDTVASEYLLKVDEASEQNNDNTDTYQLTP